MTTPAAPSPTPIVQNGFDAPLYGATVGQAFFRFWKKYAMFKGRASRSELWWMALVGFTIELVLTLLDLALTGGNWEAATDFAGVGGVASLAWGIATVVPTITLQTRRLHDIGRSGWWQLIVLVPVVGLVVLVVWLASRTRPSGSPEGLGKKLTTAR